MKKSSTIIVCIIALLLVAAGVAVSFPNYTADFNLVYGTAGTTGGNTLGSCITCHVNPTGGPRNSYGTDFAANGHDFLSIQGLDSDGDGFTNIEEILVDSFPGDAASMPVANQPSPPALTAPPAPATPTAPATPSAPQPSPAPAPGGDAVADRAITLPAAHTESEDGFLHMPGKDKPFTNGCIVCHGSELTGPASNGFAPSCFTCHGQEWDEEMPVAAIDANVAMDDSDSDDDDDDEDDDD